MPDAYETKRTIEEVIDMETGQIIASADFFNQPESIIIKYRRRLQESISRYAKPKFVCPYCKQLIKLSGMKTQRGVVSFFAHLKDSDDCEIKTSNNLTKEEIEALKYSHIRESQRHIELKEKICQALLGNESQNMGVSNVEVEKRITSEIPYLNWRQPDISAEYKGMKMVFELQLSTTFLSIIVERDIFYRMNNIFIIWVFNFSDNQQYVNMGNLMCKDIYYANKRNAFVFDETAQQLSKEKGELILNCIWFEPYIENGVFIPEKNTMKSEYLSLKDLKFDKSLFKPYYVDADKLFANYHPSLLIQREFNESSIQERFLKLTEKFQKKKEELIDRENLYLSIKEKLGLGELTLSRFKKGKKWGYEADGVLIVNPNYSEVTEFKGNQYAIIRKNKKFGFINRIGEIHIPLDYEAAYKIINNKSIVKKGREWLCLNIKDKTTKKIDCFGIHYFETSEKYLSKYNRIIKKKFLGVNRGGYNTYTNDYIFSYGIITYDGEVLLDNYNSIFTIGNWVIAARDKRGINLFTKEIKRISPVVFNEVKQDNYTENRIICKKDEKYGCINLNGDIIIPFDYDDIMRFNEGFAIAKKNKDWGMIDENGNEIIPFEFDSIGEFKSGLALAKKGFGFNKTGCIDNSGKIIIPFEYDEHSIKLTPDGIIKAKKDGKWGCFDKNGQIIIPFEFENIEEVKDGIATVKRNGYWGRIDFDGNILTSFIYNDLGTFNNGLSKVNREGKWGYINENWVEIIPCNFFYLSDFEHDIAIAAFGVNKCGAINILGDTVIDFEYESIEKFLLGKAKAEKNGRWGVIDKSGNELIENEININKYLIKGIKFEKWGIISTNGEVILNFEYDSIFDYKDGFIIASINEKFGVLNKKQEEVIGFQYDGIEFFQNQNYRVKLNNKWGIINSFGETIIPIKYDFFLPYSRGKTICFSDGYFKIEYDSSFNAIRYRAFVNGISSFGVFLTFISSDFDNLENLDKTGLLHLSEITKAKKRLEDFKKDEEIDVYILFASESKQRITFTISNPEEMTP